MNDAELIGSLLAFAVIVVIAMIFLSRRGGGPGPSAAAWTWLGLPALIIARAVGRDAIEVAVWVLVIVTFFADAVTYKLQRTALSIVRSRGYPESHRSTFLFLPHWYGVAIWIVRAATIGAFVAIGALVSWAVAIAYFVAKTLIISASPIPAEPFVKLIIDAVAADRTFIGSAETQSERLAAALEFRTRIGAWVP